MGTVMIMPIICLAPGSAYAAENSGIPVEFNGTEINTSAYTDEGTLYLPLRAISEKLGYSVEWSKDGTIAVKKSGDDILVNYKDSKVNENGHQYYVNENIINNTLYMDEEFFNDSLGLKVQRYEQNKMIEVESIKENNIDIEAVNEESKQDKIDMTLIYPKISGLADATIQNELNTFFKNEAETAKWEGQEYLKEFTSESLGYDGNLNKFETYFDYRVKYNQNDLLSIIFYDYQYTGGAHGSTIQKTYTFDLKTGKEIHFKDLFKNESGYLTLFNNVIKSEIKCRELYELAPFNSIADDQVFYLCNNGVSVYFQQYEYFPYAAGIQSFTADYSDLKEMLNPDFSFLYDTPKQLEPKTDNILNIGQMGRVILNGNPTTGYTWHYKIENEDKLKEVESAEVGWSIAIGSGSTFTWDFEAVKAGKAKITFKYYRDWEGEASTKPENIVGYEVEVR